MQTVPKFLSGSLALSALMAFARPASAQYQIIPIDPPGSLFTIPYGMNDPGIITGLYYLADHSSHGFVRSPDGTIKTPPLPFGSISTQLTGVNDSGIAVGSYLDVYGLGHGAAYDIAADTWTALPDIAGTAANLPLGITNAGLILGETVGGYSAMGQPTGDRGYFYDGSNYTFFDAPNADLSAAGTVPEDINEAGTVVGFASLVGNGGRKSGFLRDSAGNFTFLDYPGADDTFFEGINNAGVVAGSYDIGSFSHSFTWSAGSGFTSFDVPYGFNTELWGIDNRGNLVGNYVDLQQGVIRGFLAVAPVPEPGIAALLFGMGLSGCGILVRRRK